MVLTAIVAASLPRLELQPGMPPPKLESGQVVVANNEEEPLAAVPVSEFLLVIVALVCLGYFLYRFFKTRRVAGRWNTGSIIRPVIQFLLAAGLFLFLMQMLISNSQNSLPSGLPVPKPAPLIASPLGPVPPWLFWLVGMGALTISILAGVWLFGVSPGRSKTVNRVGREAEKARRALQAGQPLKDVILQCYRDMSRVMEEEQGMGREDSMTTREFEESLGAAGIPRAPLHQLTQLFEAVRYGNWQPDPEDERKAIRSLEAIMAYSREAKGAG